MTINYPVPFYPNTPDDTHCWQASLKMVLKYFEPKKDFSWEELDKITAKKENLDTWPSEGMLWLANHGYTVKVIESFNYLRFSQEGKNYIYSEFGEEVGKAQQEHADIDQGVQLAKQFISKSLWTDRVPDVEEIKNLLKEKYLVICNVNTAKMNNKNGYAGHFVVVKGFDDNHLALHDPGLPPSRERIVEDDTFNDAWGFPNEKARNIKAIKLH